MLRGIPLHLLCIMKDGDPEIYKEEIYYVGFIDPVIVNQKHVMDLHANRPKNIA